MIVWLLTHRRQEFRIGFGLLQSFEDKLHLLDRRKRVEHAAQYPDSVEVFLWDQQLFLARAGFLQVDRREDALVRELAVEMDFEVARALELFEDHVVHSASGFDQRRGDDRQGTALFDIAGRAEEPFRALQRVRVDAARQNLTRGRDDGVVRARQSGDRIEQDHHVAFMFDQALRLFDHHVGHLNVARSRLVEGRRNHFAVDRTLHVRDFFRALVYQQDDQRDFGVIFGDGVGDGLQQHRLAGARRSDDQRALPFSDRSEQVGHTPRKVLGIGLHPQMLVRIERRQIVEEDLVARDVRRFEVDRLYLDQREITLALFRRTDLARDRVAGARVDLYVSPSQIRKF